MGNMISVNGLWLPYLALPWVWLPFLIEAVLGWPIWLGAGYVYNFLWESFVTKMQLAVANFICTCCKFFLQYLCVHVAFKLPYNKVVDLFYTTTTTETVPNTTTLLGVS